jgi:16S rRNA (uracil1498-N3)-methyltransferase
MALRRFWIEASSRQGDEVHIDGDLFHHIRDVCRFQEGDRFEVLPGGGRAYLVSVTAMNKRDLRARILEQRQIPPLKKPWIHLLVSVPRFPKVDFILEKSVELGVHTVSLFVSDCSFVRKVSEVSDQRLQRWEKINRSAAQQSGRGELMQLSNPDTLENWLQKFQSKNQALGLFPYEGDAPVTWQASIREGKQSRPEEVWLFVGSEGGFSLREVELFQQYGLKPMTMGSQILRVETACVALASVIKYEFEL